MQEIRLTQGRVARVDDREYARVNAVRWTYDTGSGYAVRNVKRAGQKYKLLMHRFIVNAKPEEDVDHINRDKLDNQRSNLRRCTRAQNMWNTPLSRNNRTGFKGISQVRQRERMRYRTQIRHNGVKIHVGYYDTKEEAARAYDAKAVELRGEYAWLNFPREGVL